MSAMWSERYRPKILSDCILDHLDKPSRNVIEQSVLDDQLPNLLFYGPPGTGKTSIARILCDEERFAVNEFNGSLLEKQGVERMQAMLTTKSLFYNSRCFLIEEIDGSTEKAQLGLRQLIDSAKVPVSWICTANDVKVINAALLSRLMKIDCSYASLARGDMHRRSIVSRCRTILERENVRDVSEDAIREIVELNYPDVRETINQLQLSFGKRIAA